MMRLPGTCSRYYASLWNMRSQSSVDTPITPNDDASRLLGFALCVGALLEPLAVGRDAGSEASDWLPFFDWHYIASDFIPGLPCRLPPPGVGLGQRILRFYDPMLDVAALIFCIDLWNT
jgi:hypothetical protein